MGGGIQDWQVGFPGGTTILRSELLDSLLLLVRLVIGVVGVVGPFGNDFLLRISSPKWFPKQPISSPKWFPKQPKIYNTINQSINPAWLTSGSPSAEICAALAEIWVSLAEIWAPLAEIWASLAEIRTSLAEIWGSLELWVIE